MTLPAVPTDGLLPRPSARPGQPSLTTQRALPRSAYRRTRRHLRAATGGAPLSTASPWSSNTTTEVSSPTTTIGLVADFGNCADGERAVASMINSWKVDAVVTAGDNTYVAPKCEPFTNSVGNYYGQYFSTDKGPAFFPALGNHDYDNVGAGLDKYNAIFHFISTTADAKRRWYDVKISGIHVFVLDNYAPPADLALQQTWLKQASPPPRRIHQGYTRPIQRCNPRQDGITAAGVLMSLSPAISTSTKTSSLTASTTSPPG